MAVSNRLQRMRDSFAPTTDNADRGPSRYYPLGKVEIDQSVTFRFLSDKNPDNPRGFLKEITMHELPVNGSSKRVPCLEMFGETCPVCEQARLYYKNKEDSKGIKLWKKRNYVAQVLVIDDPLKQEVDPSNPIKLLSIGKQVLTIIQEAIYSGDVENDPDALIGGYNFVIKKTKGGAKPDGSGHFPQYMIGTRFVSKPSDVPEQLHGLIEENLIDLDDLIPQKPDVATLHADLQAAIASIEGRPAPRQQAAAPQPSAASHAAPDDDAPPFAMEQRTPAPSANVQASTQDLLARLRREQ